MSDTESIHSEPLTQTEDIERQLAEFNFEGEENSISFKTPSLKSINYPAGLWIATENIKACGWPKACGSDCSSDCIDHFKDVKVHGLDLSKYGKLNDFGEPLIIDGYMLTTIRLLVIGRSPLLKVSKQTGFPVGEWRKGDNKDLYNCVRRYLIFCLDNDNKLLNNVPLQLTAKGYFQMEFDGAYQKFKSLMVDAFNKATNKSFTGMNDTWHSMNIFVPTFTSELKGPSKDKQARACVVKDFEKPNNWKDYTIGLTTSPKDLVFKAHKLNVGWWRKAIRTTKDDIVLEYE